MVIIIIIPLVITINFIAVFPVSCRTHLVTENTPYTLVVVIHLHTCGESGVVITT